MSLVRKYAAARLHRDSARRGRRGDRGGMGAVAGEDVLAVDGEPGANPFPG